MFAQANELPTDDPLRAPANGGQAAMPAAAPAQPAKPVKASAMERLLPAKMVAAFKPKDAEPVAPPPSPSPQMNSIAGNGVVVNSGRMVAVPVFTGQAMRQVVQNANAAGLRVQMVGSGIARDQAPAAGTMVPQGTQVVVRFSR